MENHPFAPDEEQGKDNFSVCDLAGGCSIINIENGNNDDKKENIGSSSSNSSDYQTSSMASCNNEKTTILLCDIGKKCFLLMGVSSAIIVGLQIFILKKLQWNDEKFGAMVFNFFSYHFPCIPFYSFLCRFCILGMSKIKLDNIPIHVDLLLGFIGAILCSLGSFIGKSDLINASIQVFFGIVLPLFIFYKYGKGEKQEKNEFLKKIRGVMIGLTVFGGVGVLTILQLYVPQVVSLKSHILQNFPFIPVMFVDFFFVGSLTLIVFPIIFKIMTCFVFGSLSSRSCLNFDHGIGRRRNFRYHETIAAFVYLFTITNRFLMVRLLLTNINWIVFFFIQLNDFVYVISNYILKFDPKYQIVILRSFFVDVASNKTIHESKIAKKIDTTTNLGTEIIHFHRKNFQSNEEENEFNKKYSSLVIVSILSIKKVMRKVINRISNKLQIKARFKYYKYHKNILRELFLLTIYFDRLDLVVRDFLFLIPTIIQYPNIDDKKNDGIPIYVVNNSASQKILRLKMI